LGRKKGKKAAITRLAKTVGVTVTELPDDPDLDDAEGDEAELAAPVETPLDIALKEFDPEGKRDLAKIIARARAAATRITDAAEKARQVAVQIDTISSPHLRPEQIETARTTAAAPLEALETASRTAATDRATMDAKFIEGWNVAKKAKQPPRRGDVRERLSAIARFREQQEALLAPAKEAAERLIDAVPAVDTATKTVDRALATLKQAIRTALDGQARAAQQAQDAARLKADAEAAIVRCEQITRSDLVARARRAAVLTGPDPVTPPATAAAEAAKAGNWSVAFNQAKECLTAARGLERALRRAASSEAGYRDKAKTTFPALAVLRQDLARLKIRPEGVFAELKPFEDSANNFATAKAWGDALDALEELDDRITQGAAVIARFDRYLAGTPPMLLPATLASVVALPGLTTNAAILAKLREVYETQCNVSRIRWLQQLRFNPVVKGPPNGDHYTTFPDAIVSDEVSVHRRDVDDICEDLFGEAEWSAQIHSTSVLGVERYHRYWCGLYSANVQFKVKDGFAAQHPEIVAALNAQYHAMVADMQARVSDAIAKHGRVPNANIGPAVT